MLKHAQIICRIVKTQKSLLSYTKISYFFTWFPIYPQKSAKVLLVFSEYFNVVILSKFQQNGFCKVLL